MSWRLAVICSVLLHVPSGLAADVYKWKDSDGQIRYSDTPPKGKTPYQSITGTPPANAKGTSVGQGQTSNSTGGNQSVPADKEIEAAKKKALSDEAKKKELEKLDSKKVRDENCIIARKNLTNYQIGGRMYKIDENGERIYMGDSEISAGLEQAKRDVKQWCD